jgi:hypothetical protein
MLDIVVKWGRFITPIHVTTLFIIVIMVVIYHNFVRCSYHIKLKRAPGPFPIWPLLGNLPLLHKLPHQVLYNLSKTYGDIMELKLGSICTIVISSPQMAIDVLKTHDQVFASRPLPIVAHSFSYGGLNVGWAPQGDYWRHLRKLKVSEFLNRLDASKNVRDEEISFLVHSIFEDCKVIVTLISRL